jgi:NADH-quinone oxidoreductase subunit H
MWVKYTMPRIRIDHMLAFNWKFLTPLAFVLLMVIALVDRLLAGTPTWAYAGGMFLSNLLVGWITVEILRAYARGQRQAKESAQLVAQKVPGFQGTAHH